MIDKVYNTGETEEELKLCYNYEGSPLRNAQERMIEMLAFMDKICKENHIQYFIAYGTLLGAVRHGGFIPWDDDMDVIMSDRDMVKFRKIVNEQTGRFVVQNHKNDRGFLIHWNVLRDLNSEYVKDDVVHNMRKYRGVQIDIFPYEYEVNDHLREFLEKVTWHNEYEIAGKHRLVGECIYYFQRLIINIAKIKAHKKTSTLSLGYENPWKLHYKVEDIFPLSSIEFEGLQVPCPHNVKAMLESDYGKNYMNLPDKSERNHHSVDRIVFFD